MPAGATSAAILFLFLGCRSGRDLGLGGSFGRALRLILGSPTSFFRGSLFGLAILFGAAALFFASVLDCPLFTAASFLE